MDNSLQAGILTIGTEVSNGQIINSNTAWIANELTNLRLNPAWHMTVADLRTDMLDALRFLQTKVKILVVTGGLGPTSDDFTRDVIGEWAGTSLEFDNSSWDHILDRFNALGVESPESNRRQCYFPKGSRILTNSRGTAHGFRLEAHGMTLYVLPGPPEEIKAIWSEHINPELSLSTADTDTNLLLRWQCLGLSESKLGEMVEEMIEGSTLVAGYRPHLPYVEIKIWCKQSQLSHEQHRIDKIDAALTRWTFAKNDDDTIQKIWNVFTDYDEVIIDDQGSIGAIAQRIGAKWRADVKARLTIHDHFSPPDRIANVHGPRKLHLVVGPLNDEGEWEIWFKTDEVQKLQSLKLPYKRSPKRRDRERLYVCELSLAAMGRLADKGTLVL